MTTSLPSAYKYALINREAHGGEGKGILKGNNSLQPSQVYGTGRPYTTCTHTLMRMRKCSDGFKIWFLPKFYHTLTDSLKMMVPITVARAKYFLQMLNRCSVGCRFSLMQLSCGGAPGRVEVEGQLRCSQIAYQHEHVAKDAQDHRK